MISRKSIQFFYVFFTLYYVTFIEFAQAYENDHFSIFVTSEYNDTDNINGIGIAVLHKNYASNLGMSIHTSLANAEVIDEYGLYQDYLGWEIGGKVGYFSDVFLYVEAGFDAGELLLQNRNEDNNHRRYNNNTDNILEDLLVDIVSNIASVDDRKNGVDGYIGFGGGIDLGHTKIELFSRYRQIDGEFWKANNQIFYGLKATLSF